jgi:hypothetical protein
MAIWPTLASREQVAARMGIKLTAYAADRIDEANAAAARTIARKCQRPGGLHPTRRTIYRDWPNRDDVTSWRLWIGPDELISVVSVTSGGETITGTLLSDESGDNGSGPPYKQLQLDRSGSDSFGAGESSTPQRNIVIVGWTGITDDQVPAGALAAAVATTTATTITVTNAAVVGVGHQLIIDDERMVVTDRASASTGTTLSSGVDASTSTVSIPVVSGAAVHVGEIVLIDAERMRVVDIAGNALVVKRAEEGTVLAAHMAGATVYAPRLLTVARGTNGSTAATHTVDTAVTRWYPSPDATRLAIAEAITTLQQDAATWARLVGEGENAREVGAKGLKDARESVYSTGLRRKGRVWAV